MSQFIASESSDRACLDALAAQIGHQPPFTEDELAAIASLAIVHARDIAVLEHCAGLKHLRIVASELADLRVLENLTKLMDLEIHCTLLKSLHGVAACTNLDRFDMLFTSASDASDLAGMTRTECNLHGNPWADASWNSLQRDAERDDRLVDLPIELDWRRTRRLWEHSSACYGTVNDGYPLIVRPGLPTLTTNTYDALHVSGAVVDRALRENASLDSVFEKYRKRIEALDLSELARERVLGFSKDALGWISASSLAQADKIALEQFVRRFPRVKFFRTSVASIDRVAAEYRVPVPANYRALTAILDGWMPIQRVPPVRFDDFEGWSPRKDDVGSLTYQLGLRDHGDDIKAALLAAGFTSVGQSMESPASTLAIRTGDDPAIYEYSEEDISDAMSEKRDITSSIREIFPSYAVMLGHVISLHPHDIDPVLADDERR